MHKPNLYRPPPPPPRPKALSVDPLVVLSSSPTVLAAQAAQPMAPEELTDLGDEDMESWASGGTRIIPKPAAPALTMTSPPQSSGAPRTVPQSGGAPRTMPQSVGAPLTTPQGPLPSYYPVAFSTAPPPKKSNAAIWVALAGVVVLAFGVMAAVAGFFIYRAHQEAEAALLATTATVTQPETEAPTETTPTPSATSTSTYTSDVRVAPERTTAVAATKPPSVSASRVPNASGSLRTFAIATGRPVYVDGHEVGKIATACGRHFVVVGIGKGKLVDIPCTGTPITVGTPDGS